jgi:hypothetical protein
MGFKKAEKTEKASPEQERVTSAPLPADDQPEKEDPEEITLPKNKKSIRGTVIMVFILVIAAVVVYSFARKEDVVIKGHDTTYVEKKIQEVETKNIERQQQTATKIEQIAGETKEIKDILIGKNKPKAQVEANPTDIDNAVKEVQKMIQAGGGDPSMLKKGQGMPMAAPPRKPTLIKKDISSSLNTSTVIMAAAQSGIPIGTKADMGNPAEVIGTAPVMPQVLQPILPSVVSPEKKAVAPVSGVKNKNTFIPAGTMVQGELVTGALAPVKGSPATYKLPLVLIRLTKNGIMANMKTFPLKDAFVVAKAEGVWNLERVTMETYKLVMILKDGTVIEKPITGQIQGKDGIDGVPGYVVNPGETGRMAKFLAGTAAGGFFAAMAQGQQSQNTTALGTTTNIQNALLYQTATALSKSWDTFSQWYLEQAKQATPFVVANPKEKVFIVLQDGVDVSK